MIEAAAIKTADGKVWAVPRPGRHDGCFFAIAEGIGYDIKTDHGKADFPPEGERKRWLDYVRDHVQGFVTDGGEFLDRAQSYEHAKACGQLAPDIVGAKVWHQAHGGGRVLHVEPAAHPVAGRRSRCHVKFERSTDLNFWCADDELERCLIGSILTSEDLW